MANSPLNTTPRVTVRPIWLAVFGVLAAGGAVLAAVLLRARYRSPAFEPESIPLEQPLLVVTAPPAPIEIETPIAPVAPPRPNVNPLRWLGFFAVFIIAAVVLVALQNTDSSVSTLLFAALIAGSIGLSLRKYPTEIKNRITVFLQAVRQWQRLHPVLLSVGMALIGAFCFLEAAAGYYIAVDNEYLIHAPLHWTAAGVLAFGYAIWLNRAALPRFERPALVAEASTGVRWPFVAGGFLMLVALAAVNADVQHALPELHYNLQLGLLVGGVAALIWGFGRGWRWPTMSKREGLALAGIILLAFFLRVVDLESAMHRFIDEINFINGIIALWDQPTTHILLPFGDVTSFTSVYPILQIGSMSLFGDSLTAIRLVSAVFGTLTIPALYFLARSLFGRTTALIAALLLATFPAAIHFSRIGLNNVADPLFGTLALAFLARAWKANRRSDYVIAGAMLGLTQYFYEGGKLLYPALAIGWFIILWITGKGWREDREVAILTLLVMIMVAAPVYTTALTTQGLVAPRLNNMAFSLKDWHNLFAMTSAEDTGRYMHFARPFLVYINLPDTSWFYGGNQPMILSVLVPVFLLGIVILFATLRSPGSKLILFWVLGTSFGNMLLIETAWTPRYVVVFPALALLLAMGIQYGLNLFWPKGFHPTRRTIAFAAMVLVVAVGQANYYFNEHLPAMHKQFQAVEDVEDMYFRLPSIPAGTQVHIMVNATVWDYNLNALIRFWNLNITANAWLPVQLTDEYMASLPINKPQAFFIDAADTDTIKLVSRYFYLLPPQFSPFDQPRQEHIGLFYAPAFKRS